MKIIEPRNILMLAFNMGCVLSAMAADTLVQPVPSQGINVQPRPVKVTNVKAVPRDGAKLVDIYYDAIGVSGVISVTVQISADSGATYTVPATSFQGPVGDGIRSGKNRHIVWDAGADHCEWNDKYKAQVTAFDDFTTAPPPFGMVLIPAGSFQMGDAFSETPDAMPVHSVLVRPFYMDVNLVSGELWYSVLYWAVRHGYDISNAGSIRSSHPVDSLNWYQSVKWCNARSEKEGLTPVYYSDDAKTAVYRSGTIVPQARWDANGYRLPTEAEWEKAARGGLNGLKYPWGNAIAGNQANYIGSGDPFEGTGPTTPCGYYNGGQTPAGPDMANGYGLYDMAGNAWEWCWDWYAKEYYGDPSANIDPHGPATGNLRVLRGGAWYIGSWSKTSLDNLRCDYRYPLNPNGTHHAGLRCVRSIEDFKP